MDTNDSLPTTPNSDTEAQAQAVHAKPVQRRRRFSREEKRQIVQDALASGESFSLAARRHNLNANLLFKWRQQYERGLLDPQSPSPEFVSVTVASQATPESLPESHRFPKIGRMEIILANGHRLSITGKACSTTLRIALETLRS